MSKWLKLAAIITVLAILSGSMCAMAAKSAKKPSKPAAKKPAAQTPHIVQGTTQLKGEYAEIGKQYTLGKEFPMNIILNSAEYTVDQVCCGSYCYSPESEQKFLLIHYTLHNPQPREAAVDWASFKITAVDANNANLESIDNVGIKANKSTLNISMKPAQKMDVYTVIPVPAKGDVPKLIFKSGDDLVLRYNLKGKIKPLAAPFIDPKDKTGIIALAQVPAEVGTYYPLTELDVKFESATYSQKSTSSEDSEESSEESTRVLDIRLTAKNDSPNPLDIDVSTFTPSLRDADGNEIEWQQEMYQDKRDVALESKLEPTKEIKIRFRYVVPIDVEAKTFSIQQGLSRIYVYDLSSVK